MRDIQIIPDGMPRKFIIVLNLRTVESAGISGSRSRMGNRVRNTFDKVWTGDKWSLSRTHAHEFESRDAAEEYFELNRDVIESKLQH